MHRSIIKTIIIIVMCVFVAKFAQGMGKVARSDRQRALIMAICSDDDDDARRRCSNSIKEIALNRIPMHTHTLTHTTPSSSIPSSFLPCHCLPIKLAALKGF